MKTLSVLLLATAACALAQDPYVVEALTHGAKYKTRDQYLKKGLLHGKTVELASGMAMDGISKNATFFDDRDLFGSLAAAANQQMRKVDPTELKRTGMLYAYVEVIGRGAIPIGKLHRRYADDRAHLVLETADGEIIQPGKKEQIGTSGTSVGGALMGYPSGKIMLLFNFDVPPSKLQQKLTVILIDGDGHKHVKKADLSGILE